jgi:hypothetical protein
MEKLLTFNSENYEFTYFVVMAVKNASAIQAVENRLNVMAEAINELIEKDSSIDLESFKATFLRELATLLGQQTEFEFSNNLFDLMGAERTNLQLQVQELTERVSKLESALSREKVQEVETT